MSGSLLLSGERDRHGGIIINSHTLRTDDVKAFEEQLDETLSDWIRNQSYRCVWMKVHKQHAELIPSLIKLDFTFHHAKPDYVMLMRWMSTSEQNAVPRYAFHYVGAGGFVCNSAGDILVVEERWDPGLWRIPGGSLDHGESPAEAAVREVREETGVEADFLSILAFRQLRRYHHDCHDLYFLCVMRARTETIRTCPREIRRARWMKIEDYMKQERISSMHRYFAGLYLDRCHSSAIVGVDVGEGGYNTVYSVQNIP